MENKNHLLVNYQYKITKIEYNGTCTLGSGIIYHKDKEYTALIKYTKPSIKLIAVEDKEIVANFDRYTATGLNRDSECVEYLKNKYSKLIGQVLTKEKLSSDKNAFHKVKNLYDFWRDYASKLPENKQNDILALGVQLNNAKMLLQDLENQAKIHFEKYCKMRKK